MQRHMCSAQNMQSPTHATAYHHDMPDLDKQKTIDKDWLSTHAPQTGMTHVGARPGTLNMLHNTKHVPDLHSVASKT